VINFQPVGGNRAAINGDFILTAPEVQKVIQALRAGNIQIIELHNHGLTEQPRLFYMHYWGRRRRGHPGQSAVPGLGRHQPADGVDSRTCRRVTVEGRGRPTAPHQLGCSSHKQAKRSRGEHDISFLDLEPP
jgi:hypothetical protein